MIIALIALFVALGGTAVAASRYLITSTSQIRPSVIAQLGSGARVIARIRSVAPVETLSIPALAWVPLAGATWTQGAEELDQISGQISYTIATACPAPSPKVDVFLDGALTSARVGPLVSPEATAQAKTQTRWISWRSTTINRVTSAELAEPLFEPAKATTHRLTMEVADGCATAGGGGSIELSSVAFDVVGTR